MAIYRKGGDQSGLEQAAKEQKEARKNASAEERGSAGLGGGGQPYVSNLSIDKGGAFTRKYKGYGDKNPTKQYVSNVQISASQVAESRARANKKAEASGKAIPVQPKGNRTVVGGALIKKGVVEKASFKGKHYTKPSAPKRKSAGVKDVRAALKSGNISIEEAGGLNKKGLSSPIKKKKK